MIIGETSIEDIRKCVKCSWCCKHIVIPIKASKRMCSDRGIKHFKDCIIINSVCKHLSESGLCKINDRKPKNCKSFFCFNHEFSKEMKQAGAGLK